MDQGDLKYTAATVIIDMDEPYVQSILESSFAKYAPLIAIRTGSSASEPDSEGLEHKHSAQSDNPSCSLMHWREYERINWDTVHRSTNVFSNAYCIRKGLIRKAQMSFNIKLYMAKHPESILKTGVPETWLFDLDDVDYLDEALMECYEVEDGMKENEGISNPRERQQFILKPSLTGRAAGIHIFDTRERLEALLEKEFESDSEEEDEEQSQTQSSYEMVSQIREWVVQRYINKPLLLKSHDERKFHIRVYTLATGDFNVYVYRHMLALFAPQPYRQSANDLDNQRAHLTNTCIQEKHDEFDESKAVDLFWHLDLAQEKLDSIFDQICRILSDTFAAVSSETTSFQTWPNCMEQFGFDFLVDESCNVYLLEANAYPDFKQTGEGLKSVVEGFMAASVAAAVEKFLLDKDMITDGLRRMMDNDRTDLIEIFSRKTERKW